MTASKASQPPGATPPPTGRRRRPVMRWIVHVVLFIALAVGIFGLLPRLGGLTRDAAELRHARPGFVVAAVIAQGISLGCYALLYRRVLASLGARVPFWLAIAYAVANIASALPITPGGLGVVEVTLVAVTVGFGAPRPTAVLAVVGYRIVNYWLPLLPGTVAYLRLRLSPARAGQTTRAPAPPAENPPPPPAG
jgi:uncharacterized membrane protein YbhN (UPF0104 family)